MLVCDCVYVWCEGKRVVTTAQRRGSHGLLCETNKHVHACVMYIHTYMHNHTYIHTFMHTYIHTCTHTYIHACIHTCIHACKHTYTHIQTDIHVTYIHTTS